MGILWRYVPCHRGRAQVIRHVVYKVLGQNLLYIGHFTPVLFGFAHSPHLHNMLKKKKKK